MDMKIVSPKKNDWKDRWPNKSNGDKKEKKKKDDIHGDEGDIIT
jgi:hypothetical protein